MSEMTDDLKQHLLPEELALLELSWKATPGPWKILHQESTNGESCLAMNVKSDSEWSWAAWLGFRSRTNANLIAESRNMLEPLLQRLAESRAEVARLREQLQRKETK